jgi:peptidoglycan hydrolase-like protein with peptidoglycan-binding domain
LALAVPAFVGTAPAALASTDSLVTEAPRGQERCEGATLDVCERSGLREGTQGRAVRHLQGLLYLKRFYRGPIDGVFDREVAVAVATFHKAVEPPRSDESTLWQAVATWRANPPSEVFARDDWRRLHDYRLIPPKARIDQPDRIEVDIGRQLLFLILDGKVDAIVHVSTGYHPYDTPRTGYRADGSRLYYHHPFNGWSPAPGLWSIYKFWAYLGRDNNYGIHGYRSVPYYPASHGCIRVNVSDADYLDLRFFIDMPIHVWDE